MTIFLEIAKELLIPKLEDVIKKSNDDDEGLVNQAAKLVAKYTPLDVSRNEELSATKRELISNLLKDVKEFHDGDDDETTLAALKKLIETTRVAAADESRKKKRDLGKTDTALRDIEDFLQLIYLRLGNPIIHTRSDNQTLLNLQHDENPFNSFLRFAGLYFAQKIVDEQQKGALEKLASTQVTTLKNLAQEKEKLLIDTISNCNTAINAIKETLPDYLQLRKETVQDKIRLLNSANIALCERYAPRVPYFQIPLPFFHPGPAFLKECMDKALAEIENPRPEAAASAPAGEEKQAASAEEEKQAASAGQPEEPEAQQAETQHTANLVHALNVTEPEERIAVSTAALADRARATVASVDQQQHQQQQQQQQTSKRGKGAQRS